MRDRWALEEHLSTAENNKLWDDSGEAARNGKRYMDYVESHLLDVDERPDRLSMFACLPTQDGAEAVAELRRAVGELGAVGALINGARKIGRDNVRRLFPSIGLPVPTGGRGHPHRAGCGRVTTH